MSLSKTKVILGRTVDISKVQNYSDEESLEARNTNLRHTRSQRSRRNSSVSRRNNERELLLDQASTLRDFENLFAALDAIEEWKCVADDISK